MRILQSVKKHQQNAHSESKTINESVKYYQTIFAENEKHYFEIDSSSKSTMSKMNCDVSETMSRYNIHVQRKRKQLTMISMNIEDTK